MSGAPVDVPNPHQEDDDDDEEMPRVQMTRRRFVLGLGLIFAVVALLYYGLPRIAGIDETWHRIEHDDHVHDIGQDEEPHPVRPSGSSCCAIRACSRARRRGGTRASTSA